MSVYIPFSLYYTVGVSSEIPSLGFEKVVKPSETDVLITDAKLYTNFTKEDFKHPFVIARGGGDANTVLGGAPTLEEGLIQAAKHAKSRIVVFWTGEVEDPVSVSILTRRDLDEIFVSYRVNRNDVLIAIRTITKQTFRERYTEMVGVVTYKHLTRHLPNAEGTYLHELESTLIHGSERADRTVSGTIAQFGRFLQFDLTQEFPLFTTKTVWWKGVVAELLWFLNGDTDVRTLQAQKVGIWDEDAKRAAALTHNGKPLPGGELGPTYGFQWRHFGGTYLAHPEALAGKRHAGGVDQIAQLVKELKTNPTSRRHVLTAWNPADVSKVVLPPCHLGATFDVELPASKEADSLSRPELGRLNCLFYMRSNDEFLGAPFNIASYALLTCILAALTGLKPGRLVMAVANGHIYKHHLEQVEAQLARPQRPLPTLNLDAKDLQLKVGPELNFRALSMVDFPLIGYHPHGPLKAAVPAERVLQAAIPPAGVPGDALPVPSS